MPFKKIIIDLAIIIANFIDVELPLFFKRKNSKIFSYEKNFNGILIMPCDPAEPAGSMGDIAMLSGLMQTLRSQNENVTFTLLGKNTQTINIPDVGDVDVISAWCGRKGALEFDKLIRMHDAFYGVGADVMDGKYGAALVCRFASYCNHAARLGKLVTITGFSFNSTPRMPSVYALTNLDSRVKINLRDQQSFNRFNSKVGVAAQLSADVAFLMRPSLQIDIATENWINQIRNLGFKPVGVNLSNHAFAEVILNKGVDYLIEEIAKQLSLAAKKNYIAYLLMPHDVKSKSGDIFLLKLLMGKLDFYGVKNTYSVSLTDPSKIKRLCEKLDFVITGRMHLAIAALGVKTPVISITYQDKFEGLYQHFNLSPLYMIRPIDCMRDNFSALIEKIIEDLDSLISTLELSRPSVKSLALKNI